MTGQRYLEEYMNRLGWGSGFNLPVANDENRELEKQLEAKQRKVVEYRSALDDETRRVEDLKTHLNRSSVLITNMGKMAQTQRGTLEHSRNLNAAAHNTLKNFGRDLKAKKLALENHQRRLGTVRSDLEKRQRRVDQLSAEVEWDQKAIATLRGSSKDEEADVELMAKYFHLDKNTIKEGELAYSKMKDKGDKLRAELETQLSLTKSAELALNSVCNQFRQAHNSRNEAVEIWKGVIESLKMRDADLELLAQDYVVLKQNVRIANQEIQEREYMLKTSERNTAELEALLRKVEKSSATLRQRISSHQSALKDYVSELTQTRLVVNDTLTQVRTQKKRKADCEAEAQNVDAREAELRFELDSIRVQHKKFKFGSSSTDEKFRQISSILDYEEERLANQESETERRRHLLLQSTNGIGELRKTLETLGFETKGKENVLVQTKRITDSQNFEIENNRRLFHEVDQRLLSLQEKIGKFLTEIDQVEGRPSVILGKLKKLREEFKSAIRDKAKQENIVGYTDSILQRLKKEITQFAEQGRAMDAGNENLRILITTFQKDSFSGVKTLQQTKFNFQMVLLTRNRLAEALSRRKRRCFSASKQYLELETATSERRSEIEVHLKLLDQRKKNLLEIKGRILLNLNDIQSYTRHWKTKYEFVMTTMANGAEEGGASEAFLIVKFAQERECLKHEGHMWDNRVKEAEKEVEGLQNTLALLSNSNQNFKASLAPPWKNANMASKASRTEKLYNDFQILKLRSERRLGALLATAEEQRAELHQLEGGVQMLRETLLDRRQELNSAYQEIANQKAKIDRSSLLTRRLLRQMEEIGPEELQFIETEIKLRCLREKFEFSIKTMKKTTQTFPVLQPWILSYFKSNNLFTKLAEKLEKQDSSERYTEKSPAPKTSERDKWPRPFSRHISVTSQVNVERITSASIAPPRLPLSPPPEVSQEESRSRGILRRGHSLK